MSTLVFKPSGFVFDPGGRMPFSKDFRVGVSLPLPWYGINFGASYLNNDEGGLSTLAYSIRYATTQFNAATCLGGNVRYPDGRTDCTGTAAVTDAVIQGVGKNQKIATVFTAPPVPCPPGQKETFGCAVPGAAVLPPTFLGTLGGTTQSVSLYPGSATTRNKRERLNQLDLKVSKTFRVRN